MTSPRGAMRSRSGAAGFTLLEVLLALALAVLILVLAGSIYTTTTRTLAGQENRQQGRHAAYRALETISRDLAGALPHTQAAGRAFELGETADAPGFSACRFSTAAIPPNEVEARWYGVREIAYRVEPGPGGRWRLLRVQSAREGRQADAPPVTTVLQQGVTGFRIAFLRGETWQDHWSEQAFKKTPSAARLTLQYGEHEDEVLQTEVLIPAGHVVPSTLERSAQP